MLSILWVAVDPAPDTSEAQQVVCCAPWKAHLQKEETGAGEAACPRPPGGWSAGPRKCSAGLSVGAGGSSPPAASHPGGGPSAINLAPQRRRVGALGGPESAQGVGRGVRPMEGRRDAGRSGPSSDWLSTVHVILGAGLRAGPSRQRGWPHAWSGGPQRGAGPSGEPRGARRWGGAPR